MNLVNIFKQRYIDMCINCPEIQEEWGKKLGDVVYYKESVQPFLIYEEEMMWIPRQDQIQYLALQKIKHNVPDLKLEIYMKREVSTHYCYSKHSKFTLNEMWLIFYMSYFYKKTWRHERLEWLV